MSLLNTCQGNNKAVPSGYCFALTSLSSSPKGSVMYYYNQTCTNTNSNTINYYCLYQFYDPSTQNCGDIKNVKEYISLV